MHRACWTDNFRVVAAGTGQERLRTAVRARLMPERRIDPAERQLRPKPGGLQIQRRLR